MIIKTQKDSKRGRNKQVNLRLFPEELEQIQDDSQLCGMSVNSYIRLVLLEAPIPRQARRSTIEIESLSKLLSHLGKLGSNMNQIARRVNSYMAFDTKHLEYQIEVLKTLQRDVMDALKKV